MKKPEKEKTIQTAARVAVSILGLAAVFLIGRQAGSMIYRQEDVGEEREESMQASGDASLPTAKPALTEEELEELMRTAKGSAGEEPEASRESDGEDGNTAEEEIPVDFEYLKTLNRDIYAWITVPGTNIDYPVLQHPSDDGFYLNHNLDGSYGYPGCIYTESLNSKDFTDANTVLYGHNLKAGTMFTQLHLFEDGDFFEENDEVIIYLPEKALHYRIFAAHVYDDRHLLYSFDFSDRDIFASYIESIYDIRDMTANVRKDFTVTEEDRIVTLETCMPSEADAEKRLLVQAVLLEE